jgi:hypothetical protein
MLVFLLAIVVPCAGAVSAFAKDKGDEQNMTLEQIKNQVSEAAQKGRRLIVRLRSGGTISGDVRPETEDTFLIGQSAGVLGLKKPKETTLRYADVLSVKGRNPVIKGCQGSWRNRSGSCLYPRRLNPLLGGPSVRAFMSLLLNSASLRFRPKAPCVE